jgi:Arc/MetJ-type ribon-helix-helix transcriptional regulator
MDMRKSKKVVKVSASLPPDLLSWMDAQVDSMRFSSRSHGIAFAIDALRRKDDKPKGAKR